MGVTWENVKKRLVELQKSVPQPLKIELTYKDDRREILTLNELLERDHSDFWTFKVVEGGKLEEAHKLLEWLAPECIIK